MGTQALMALEDSGFSILLNSYSWIAFLEFTFVTLCFATIYGTLMVKQCDDINFLRCLIFFSVQDNVVMLQIMVCALIPLKLFSFVHVLMEAKPKALAFIIIPCM